MHKHIHRQALSFRSALQGIAWAFYTQSHFQFHIIVGVVVMAFGFALNISTVEYALLVLVIFGVLVGELFNTAVESVVDMVTDEWHGHAKVAKDVSAGAVLAVSLGAVLVGCIIFIPRVLVLLNS